VTRANVFDPDLEPDDTDPEGFRVLAVKVGAEAGAERLGASLYELPPGQTSCPHHWHAATEEMLIVLAGRPTLRTPDGERELAEGEVVAFVRGERGAHSVTNRTDAPVRFLMVSEMNAPEVCVYVDSNKIMAREQAPGTPATGVRAIFRAGDTVDYWDGEVAPDESS
jgi:uncharacterized cupin superfamily protein